MKNSSLAISIRNQHSEYFYAGYNMLQLARVQHLVHNGLSAQSIHLWERHAKEGLPRLEIKHGPTILATEPPCHPQC